MNIYHFTTKQNCFIAAMVLVVFLLGGCGGGGGSSSTAPTVPPTATTPPASTPPAAPSDPVEDEIIVLVDFTQVETIQSSEGTTVALVDNFHNAGQRDYNSHGDRMIQVYENYRGQSVNAYGGDWTEWKIGEDGFVILNGSTMAGLAQAAEDGNKQVNISIHSAWTLEKTQDFENGVYLGAIETLDFAAKKEVVVIQSTENGQGDCSVTETAGNGHQFQPCGVLADAAFLAGTEIQYLLVGFIREDGTRDGYVYGDHVVYLDQGANSTSEAAQIVGSIFATWRESSNLNYNELIPEFRNQCIQDQVLICQ